MASRMLLLLCLISSLSVVNCLVECQTTSWWVMQPIAKSLLQSFLTIPDEQLTFNASNPLAKCMRPDEHPVYFEFNRQNDCQDNSLPPWLANATAQTFVEFKLEIPYLIRRNKTVMFKPLLYENSRLNVEATRLVYGLPAQLATMQADFQQNKFSILYKKGSLEVSFEPLAPALVPFGSAGTGNFSSFVDANVSPWLCFPPLSITNPTKCASDLYSFPQKALVRPVKMTLQVVGDILEHIPAGIYTNAGDQPVGAWQVDVHLKIIPPYECP